VEVAATEGGEEAPAAAPEAAPAEPATGGETPGEE